MVAGVIGVNVCGSGHPRGVVCVVYAKTMGCKSGGAGVSRPMNESFARVFVGEDYGAVVERAYGWGR